MNIEAALNPEQLKVVREADGHSLVLAGAGSGKTRTLIYRLAYLFQRNVPLDEIMLLTFTNKAAKEMLFRAQNLIGVTYMFPYGGTFHHVANLFLHRFSSLVGLPDDYSIIDKEDEKDLLKGCLVNLAAKFGNYAPKPGLLSSIYGLSRNSCCPVADTIARRFPALINSTDVFLEIFNSYLEEKKKQHLLDFDDLLCYWNQLLDNEIYRNFMDRIHYVLVDEYQDTNRLQFEILEKLVPKDGNLLVVGDDAQSIYSFRAAEIRNILDFQERFPGCRVFRLTTNYRSTPEILDLANASISKNMHQYPKDLKPVLPTGLIPRIVKCGDQHQEALFIVQQIRKLKEAGTEPSEIAVLFRARYQALRLEMQLKKDGMPFVVRGGRGFFEQSHIRDIMAFLRLLFHPFNLQDFLRVIKLFPGIGNKNAETLHFRFIREFHGDRLSDPEDLQPVRLSKKVEEGWAMFAQLYAKTMTMEKGGEIVTAILNDFYSNYLSMEYEDADEREAEIEELGILAGSTNIRDFIHLAVLDEDIKNDQYSSSEEESSVILSTIHQAKGLEWSVVFILGVSQGIFPDSRNEDKEGIEEERRLFYVAVTRSKKELYISYPDLVEKYGSASVRGGKQKYLAMVSPSKFLTELPAECYETWKVNLNHAFSF